MRVPTAKMQLRRVVQFIAMTFGIWFLSAMNRGWNDLRAIKAIHGMGGHFRESTPNSRSRISLLAQQVIRRLFGPGLSRPTPHLVFQRAHQKRWTPSEMRRYGSNATSAQLSLWEPWTLENVLALKPHIARMTELRQLSFDDTPLPRHGLSIVSGLTQLTYLNVEQTQITSVDLQYLADLENLTHLNLRRTRIRNDGLAHLKKLTKLQWLLLGSTEIGDAGLQHIAHLTQLQTLNLENTRVTDDGLVHLEGLTNLESLDLGLTAVTDASLNRLTALRKLRKLTVGHQVSNTGLVWLRANLPNCEINRSFHTGRRELTNDE